MPELPNVQQNNEEVLNNIQSLQKMEQDLFSSLETNSNLSAQEQEQIIEKINKISNMRINLYKTLNNVNVFFKDALQSSVGTLKEQSTAISIVESELNESKKRLKLLEEEKNNKIRLVEINNYYGEKYAEHTQLMKVIIYTLIPVIILSLLYNKNILPTPVYYVLLVIVSLIGAVYFWKTFVSIISRDNMNYDAYDWPFDASTAPVADTTLSEGDPWATATNLGTCVGEYCCADDLIYDSSLNQCVVSISETETTEGFLTESMINNILIKSQPGKYKTDYSLQENYNPYNKN
jgi:hypothetical protein